MRDDVFTRCSGLTLRSMSTGCRRARYRTLTGRDFANVELIMSTSTPYFRAVAFVGSASSGKSAFSLLGEGCVVFEGVDTDHEDTQRRRRQSVGHFTQASAFGRYQR